MSLFFIHVIIIFLMGIKPKMSGDTTDQKENKSLKYEKSNVVYYKTGKVHIVSNVLLIKMFLLNCNAKSICFMVVC